MINIPITDLASLCDMDHYNNFPRIACKIWKLMDYESFVYFQSINYKKGEYVANDTTKQKIAVLNNKLTNNKINIIKELNEINKEKNNSDILVKKQKKLFKKIENIISNNKNDILNTFQNNEDLDNKIMDLKKLINTATNTVYGNKNEYNGYKYFVNNTDKKILRKQVKMRKLIFNIDNIKWYITGISDGETTSNEIIEIKNRQKCLFNTVRDYEMCQIQSYLYISNIDKAYLIELITNNNEQKGNIINIDRDEQYYLSIIQPNIIKFIKFMMSLIFNYDYYNFTNNEKELIKTELINNDKAKYVYSLIYK